ncbi:MAG: methyltransferase domain-containing protein [Phycisphaerae bacterium]|nr:methyltransferase domain-containing protein [Phycisphaerae bacterium]
MTRVNRYVVVVMFVVLGGVCLEWALGESDKNTRISDPKMHRRVGARSYPYRTKSAYVLKEINLQAGEVAVDIGAGDGFWTEKMAKSVGAGGTVHAAEVSKKMVDKLKKKYASTPQIKPYLCKKDSTGLGPNSCDVAFLSQAYHHLPKGKRVDYLKHLRTVIKPTGRVVIIEKYIENGMGHGTHGTLLSRLIGQAEQAGWVPLRVELMTGTYHYIAILAQKDLFPPEPKRKPKTKPKPKTRPKPPAKPAAGAKR